MEPASFFFFINYSLQHLVALSLDIIHLYCFVLPRLHESNYGVNIFQIKTFNHDDDNGERLTQPNQTKSKESEHSVCVRVCGREYQVTKHQSKH